MEQPHLEIAEQPQAEPDPGVRVTTMDDLAEVYPACVAMYSEEVGSRLSRAVAGSCTERGSAS